MPERLHPPAKTPEAPSPKKKGETSAPSLLVHYYGVLFLAIVGAFLLAGWGILRPQLEGYKKLLAQITSKSALLEGEQGYLNSLEQSIAAAQKIPEETLQDVEEALPSEPGIPELIIRLSRIAEEYNVQLSNIQFTEPVVTEIGTGKESKQVIPMKSIGINMNLASPSYAATRRYLDAIERNLRLFDVKTISISPGQGEDGQSYSIELRTYILPPVERP